MLRQIWFTLYKIRMVHVHNRDTDWSGNCWCYFRNPYRRASYRSVLLDLNLNTVVLREVQTGFTTPKNRSYWWRLYNPTKIRYKEFGWQLFFYVSIVTNTVWKSHHRELKLYFVIFTAANEDAAEAEAAVSNCLQSPCKTGNRTCTSTAGQDQVPYNCTCDQSGDKITKGIQFFYARLQLAKCFYSSQVWHDVCEFKRVVLGSHIKSNR